MPSYTTPSVATLMRTEGGKTVRKASKQANKVDPVVKTSSMMRMWRKGSRSVALSCAQVMPHSNVVMMVMSFFICLHIYVRALTRESFRKNAAGCKKNHTSSCSTISALAKG